VIGKPFYRKGREGRKGTFSEIPTLSLSKGRELYSIDEHPGME